MTVSADSPPAELTVLGGGITGLAIAYLAARQGIKVRIIEGSCQFGGLLNTFEIAGTRLEYYYHHFFTHDAEIGWLFQDLGIEQRVRFFDTSMGIYRNGKIFTFNSVADLLKFDPIGLADKLRWGLSTLYLAKTAKWQDSEEISALDWFYRHAGSRATKAIWKPMLDIKFGPYAHRVPLAWMIGRLRQRWCSRGHGSDRLGYLDGSLHVLLVRLIARLRDLNVELITADPLQSLCIRNGVLESIRTSRAEYRGGKFVLTIPTIHLPALLEHTAPALAQQLRAVEYFGAVCTILETNRQLSDIYWLNVADDGFPFGGIIEHTNFVPPDRYRGQHITYLSRYFSENEPLATLGRQQLGELMISGLARVYPGFQRSWIRAVHVFRTMTAAVVCDLGFSRKVSPCRTGIDNLYLANMTHVYPDERSINNSVRVAAEACRTMGFRADMVPTNASLAGKIGFRTSALP